MSTHRQTTIEHHSIIPIFLPFLFLCVTVTWTYRVCMVCESLHVWHAELFSQVFWISLSLVGHTRHPVLQANSSKGEKGPVLPWVSWCLSPYANECNAILEKDECIFQVDLLNFPRRVSIRTNSTLMTILSKYNFPFSFKWWGHFLIVISRMPV